MLSRKHAIIQKISSDHHNHAKVWTILQTYLLAWWLTKRTSDEQNGKFCFLFDNKSEKVYHCLLTFKRVLVTMLLGLSFQEHLVKPLNFKVLLFFICKKEEKDKKKRIYNLLKTRTLRFSLQILFWWQKIQWLNKGFRKKKQDNSVVSMVGQTKF